MPAPYPQRPATALRSLEAPRGRLLPNTSTRIKLLQDSRYGWMRYGGQVTPSNLRKQWHQELNEKFFIPCTILESKSYNADIKAGHFRPFEKSDSVVICSYQFARNKASDVHAMPWDLVVIDEAHRLRNVYKTSNIIANTLKSALSERNKLLLTATPLQNSLLELYGLVSFIDEHTF
jgi:adenine-specific DNA-methyltransferase